MSFFDLPFFHFCFYFHKFIKDFHLFIFSYFIEDKKDDNLIRKNKDPFLLLFLLIDESL